MLIFHEGFPRSGKSYAACVDHIIPALKAGRHVFACIEGLNFDKFAQVCELPIDVVYDLLHQLTPDDVSPENLPKLKARYAILDDEGSPKRVKNGYGEESVESLLQNSFLIIDEIHNHYPADRKALSSDVLKFIAEHGHDGIDILLMSQEFKEVHKSWRVRVPRKLVFIKKTAIGRPNEYKWEAWEATKPDKFQKISGGGGKYDPKYFGLYKSHTEGTTNTGSLEDDRINIFKQGTFRYGLPLAGVAFVLAVVFLWRFFHDSENGVVKVKASPVVESGRVVVPASSAPAPSAPVLPPGYKMSLSEDNQPRKYVDYFDKVAEGNRVRYSGFYSNGEQSYGFIDVYDESLRRLYKIKTTQLQKMGWNVRIDSESIEIWRTQDKAEIRYYATHFPLEVAGRVAKSYNQQAALGAYGGH